MTNLYYTPGSFTKLTLARAEAVNTQLSAIETAFDKVPPQLELEQARATYALDTGAADAYVVALPHTLAAYTTGLHIRVKIANSNTGPATINVDGLGAVAIKRLDGSALIANDLPAGAIVGMDYDGTQFLTSGDSAAASATAAASSATAAASSATAAASSATTAAAAVASVALAPVALNYIRGNSGATAYEARTPSQVFSDIAGATLIAIAALTGLTDNAIVRLDGTTGVYQQSGWTIDDSDTMLAADKILQRAVFKDYGETLNAIGSIGGGTQDIDLTLGNVISGTVDTSTTTFTFSNPPASGTCGSFTLFLTNGGSQTVNWPASVDWASGTAPTLTPAGVDILTFVTLDGGTTWYGFVAGLAMA